jgi:hypothetical protein
MKIAIFINNLIDLGVLEAVKKYYKKQDPQASIFLSNLHIMQTEVQDIAIVNHYHLRWNHNDGIILFLNVEDALKNAQNYPSAKQLLITKEELRLLTKDILESCDILIRSKTNQIRKAKNAELQSIIRH